MVEPLTQEERDEHMSKLVPEASEVVCAVYASGYWGVGREDEEELFDVRISCRIARKLGVSHFGLQDVSTRALKTAVDIFREDGRDSTLIVPLGFSGISCIP